MPLPMQGNELLPGQENIIRRGFRTRTPDRRGGDRALDARELIGKAAADELGGERGPLGFTVIAARFAEILAKMMGKDVDQRAFKLLGIGVAEFGGGQFLEMIVQQPGVIDCSLEDQRFATRNRGTMAA